MSTTYDKNGKLTEITFTQQTSGDVTWNTTNGPVKGNGDATGSGSASSTDKKTHVTTTKLKVTDENRAIVNEWLSRAYVTDPHSGTTTLTIPPNVLNPDSPVWPALNKVSFWGCVVGWFWGYRYRMCVWLLM
jgi:hypothetical protein